VDAWNAIGETACMTTMPRIGPYWRKRAGLILSVFALWTLAGQPALAQTQAAKPAVKAAAQPPAQPAAPPPAPSNDDIIHNKIAVFAALDKVTARVSKLEIPIDKTVKFGALTVTPRVCDTRPPTEPPHTVAFVEVDEIKLNGQKSRIFTGWMFAQSPGLHAVEHPVYDVWLTNCKMSEGDTSSASNAK
jgi:hypothetical protein